MLETSAGTVHVVMEHFTFEMQETLDRFQAGDLPFSGLLAAYAEGDEGHDLAAYEPLLQHARAHSARVRLHGGFIPRSYARTLMREGLPVALDAAKQAGFIAVSPEGFNPDPRPFLVLAHTSVRPRAAPGAR